MPITRRLTLETVDFDNREEVTAFFGQMTNEGMERVRAEGAELRARGLMDEEGNLLIDELPPDMIEGADRDFGG
jgi:hypothetical protein